MNSVPIDQLMVGDAVESRKTISESDVYLFAGVTGDFNPVHVDAEYAKGTLVRRPRRPRPAHLLPLRRAARDRAARPRDDRVSNQVRYEAPVFIGDTIAVRVEVGELDPERNRATMTSPGATRTASRSPRARWSSPPQEPVTL